MRKMMKSIAAVLAVSALMAGSAFAAEKLAVKGTDGTTTKFYVDENGAVVASSTVTSNGVQVNDVNGTGKAILSPTGYLGVGTVAPNVAVHGKGNTANQTQLLMTRQDTNNTGGAGFIAYHNNITNASCTAASTPSACCTGPGTGTCPSTVIPASNDRLGYFLFGGYKTNGTTPANAAGMSSRAEAQWTDTFTPAYFAFETVGTASTSRYERFRISGNGNIVTGNLGGSASTDMTTAVTDGFLYIPNVAGTLTSCASVTNYPGHVPVWFDTANAKICTCQAGALKCTPALTTP